MKNKDTFLNCNALLELKKALWTKIKIPLLYSLGWKKFALVLNPTDRLLQK